MQESSSQIHSSNSSPLLCSGGIFLGLRGDGVWRGRLSAVVLSHSAINVRWTSHVCVLWCGGTKCQVSRCIILSSFAPLYLPLLQCWLSRIYHQRASPRNDIPPHRLLRTGTIPNKESTVGSLRMAGHNTHQNRKDGIPLL